MQAEPLADLITAKQNQTLIIAPAVCHNQQLTTATYGLCLTHILLIQGYSRLGWVLQDSRRNAERVRLHVSSSCQTKLISTRKPSLEVTPTTLATILASQCNCSAYPMGCVCLNFCMAGTSLQLPIQVCFSATIGHPTSKIHCQAVAELIFLL